MVSMAEQYLSQGIVEFIPLNHIFKTTSIRKDMINGVALHVPPIGFQTEVTDALEALHSESLVTEHHPAILKQFNLLLYGSRSLVCHIS